MNLQKTPMAAALLSAGLLSVALTGCGGDSSNSAASLSGLVLGSYYEGASVCLDANANGTIDSGETNCTTTDASGKFTLSGVSSGALIVTIPTSAKEHATQGGTGTAVATALTFRAPSGVTNVSAISTEMATLMDTGLTLAEAKTNLASKYGVTADELVADFNTASSTTLKDASDTYSANLASATPTSTDLAKIEHVIVIYAENHSFDNFYGSFPGANGRPTSPDKQLDRDGVALTELPPIWGGLSGADTASAPSGTSVYAATVDTAGGAVASTITQTQTSGMANAPFQIDSSSFNGTGTAVGQDVVTMDMYHRFYNEQMQIGADGKKLSVVAWGDSGGMVMGYYNANDNKLGTYAQNYTLADNFFQAAFGGSFLNHQYLICACAPEYPNATTDDNGTGTAVSPVVSVVDTGDGKGRTGIQGVALGVKSTSNASAMDGQASFTADSYLTPQLTVNTSTGQATYGSGTWYGVNTMQPPYQPSSNAPASSDTTYLLAERSSSKKNTLPPQTAKTIGDALDAKSVDWAWYSGGWNQALAGTATGTSTRSTSTLSSAAVNFQYHHQPFNYYAEFDPTTTDGAAYRTAHLKDETDLTTAISGGTLKAVSFWKPNGPYNQHPGYASVKEGDDKIAALIDSVMSSSTYKNNTLIIVTYDEFGGQWDHVKVPKGDWVGPGSRIPAILIGNYVKKGFVDHTQYDTASILRFLVTWKSLDASTYLPGLAMRNTALVANGNKAMGNLTNALSFTTTVN